MGYQEVESTKISINLGGGQQKTFYGRWLNMSPGKTGLTPEEWSGLVAYVLDGLGLRDGLDTALGSYYADWYSAVMAYNWIGAGLRRPSNLDEKTASMLLRDAHKNQPHILAGLVAAAPLWTQVVTEAVSGGEGAGAVLDILQAASIMKTLEHASELERKGAEIEAARLAGERRSRESLRGPTASERSKVPMIIIIVAVALAVILILWRKRNG